MKVSEQWKGALKMFGVLFAVAVLALACFCLVKTLTVADTSKVLSLGDLTGEIEKEEAELALLQEIRDLLSEPKVDEKVVEDVVPAETLIVIVDGDELCVGPGIAESVTPDGTPVVVKVDQGETLTFGEGVYWCGSDWFPSQASLVARWPIHVGEFLAKPENAESLILDIVDGKLVPYGEAQTTDLGEVAVVTPEPSEEAPAPGDVAWHQDTNADQWEASPVGQLESDLWILAETWGKIDGGIKSYVVLIPSDAVAWFQYHYGGTGWWLPNDIDPQERAREHADMLEDRDGVRPIVILLPEDAFPLLGCLQSYPIRDNLRTCDPVGDRPGFSLEVGVPFPGYFPQP